TSKSRLQRFIDNPHKYLLRTPTGCSPMLVLSRDGTVLPKAGIDNDALIAGLASRMGLTAASLPEFCQMWKLHREECARRDTTLKQRAMNDDNKMKQREERLRKKKEAESKKKKTTKGKKGDEKAADESEPIAHEEEKKEEEVQKAQTTEDVLRTKISEAV